MMSYEYINSNCAGRSVSRYGADLRNALPKSRFFRCLGTSIALLMIFLMASCGDARNRTELAERMAAEEGRAGDDKRIAELKSDIRAVDDQVEQTIESVRKKGDYWRLLGMKYMDYRMWDEAMRAFEEAVSINPEHAPLLYNLGLSAGQMALSADSEDQRRIYLGKSEFAYRRAIEVDSRYSPAMYALGVLLVFELGQPMEAVSVLEDYISIEKSDIPARFLLARAYLEIGYPSESLDLYEEIGRLARDPADAEKADELYNRVIGGDYGI